MSWRVVVYGLAGIGALCVGLMAGLLALMGWVDWATRRDTRRRDRPIPHDDTWTRFERSEWTNQEEGR